MYRENTQDVTMFGRERISHLHPQDERPLASSITD